jgi:hypothetical protein
MDIMHNIALDTSNAVVEQVSETCWQYVLTVGKLPIAVGCGFESLAAAQEAAFAAMVELEPCKPGAEA